MTLLHYSISDSFIDLYYHPVLWVDDMQITSDSIQIKIISNKIERMKFYSSPIIISKA